MNLVPHDDNLESSLIGGILLNPNEYSDIQEFFHEELFFDPANRIMSKAIISLRNDNKPIDVLSVVQWVKSHGLLNVCEYYRVSATTDRGIVSGFMERVLILNQLYIRRKLIVKHTELIKTASEDTCDVFELIGEQEKVLNEVTSKVSVGKTFDAVDCHLELIDHLDKLEKLVKGELIGIDTGFKDLNDLTAGWQKTDLIILAGRPGMGKTSFVLNCVSAAATKKPVLMFSLEMSKLQLYARLCSQITSIPLERFLKVRMNEGERTLFNQLTYNLSQSQLYIEDKGGMDINYIRTKSRKLARDKKIELIVIDYLQLISRPKTNKSTNDEISEVSGALKGLAKELNIPVIALSQLTRAVDSTPDKRPGLTHLRDGGSIEQDADIVAFIYRPEYYGIMDDGNGNSTIGKAEIIVAKHRNGGLEDILLGFDGKCTNFYDLKANRLSEIGAQESKPIKINQDFLKQSF